MMETRRRLPLRDLPLEHFLTPSVFKTPRKHKRPLSPSHTLPFNPAKRRVLDAEGILSSSNAAKSSPSLPVPSMPSSSMTPTRPSRLGNGLARSHVNSQAAIPLRRQSPPREVNPSPTTESSMDPQSRHYPGFDIFRECGHRRGSPSPRHSLLSGSDSQGDRSEEDKENVPLKRKAKKLGSKKRLSSGLDGSDTSCLGTPAQGSKVVHLERTPFSPRQALR